MSKVQSPKSDEHDSSSATAIEPEHKQPVAEETAKSPDDIGRWTLDVGLRVRDLRKAFTSPTGQKIEVLGGASFSVAPGEVLAITGASGAGKSTLLHLIGGFEAADGGAIQFGRLNVARASPAALASFRKASVGFIFQFHHLLAGLTATENVVMPLLISRRERGQSLERACAMLEGMGLGERAAHPVSHLSAGEQQRVAVARALINGPGLLLADEPTGNVDETAADQIAEQILSYCHQRSAPAVIATHSREVARRCDRVLVLENGRLESIVRAAARE